MDAACASAREERRSGAVVHCGSEGTFLVGQSHVGRASPNRQVSFRQVEFSEHPSAASDILGLTRDVHAGRLGLGFK